MTETTTRSARKLATVETIAEIAPIPEADAIERARIRGWDVVVRKGEFQVGDACVYFEIDALLDVDDERFAFLAPRGVRVDATGRRGHVLRTARLRGQVSQGLALPLADFPEARGMNPGDDLTEALDVIVWDPPLPASLGGQAIGMRPIWIPKTDEDRIQNRRDLLALTDLDWTATEKIDGSSMSVYIDEYEQDEGVCSRNLDLIDHSGNTLWALARGLNLHTLMRAEFGWEEFASGRRAAIQGEAYGEGIQGNPLKVKGQHFAAFGLIVDGRRIPRDEWPSWLLALSVPTYDLPFPSTSDEALAQVDGIKSLVAPQRAAEGVVWSAGGPNQHVSFKVISNRYLIKNEQ